MKKVGVISLLARVNCDKKFISKFSITKKIKNLKKDRTC